MEKCLLSVDWDYFVQTRQYNIGFYSENKRSMIDLWYKRYFAAKARGEDIQKAYWLSPKFCTFWDRIKKHFRFDRGVRVSVSDSHALSYKMAKENNLKAVCLFDSHADLGYGDLAPPDLELNCSNWLGRLLKDGLVNKAYIFYSPYTAERPEDFSAMNSAYNIKYLNLNSLDKCLLVSAIHIARSGTWTPPWFDDRFARFINALGLPYKLVDCSERKWDTKGMSLSEQINYLLA